MQEEELLDKRNEEEVATPQGDGYLVEALKQQKANSVSKEEYGKLLEQNKMLAQALVEGKQLDAPEEKEEPVDINKLREELFYGENDNLEYVKKALALREALINDGQPDPFLPIGHEIQPTSDDVEAVERVVEVYKECIEKCEGDSGTFTALLMNKTNDIKLPNRNRR